MTKEFEKRVERELAVEIGNIYYWTETAYYAGIQRIDKIIWNSAN